MANAAASQGTRVSVDDYWSSLDDDALRRVVWITADPMKLENVHPRIPPDLPDFIIELEYQLDSATDEPVRCAHCPHHQAHWHGFVLLATDGRRYLLGSRCGPKAYASHYFIASKSRSIAQKRSAALLNWDATRDRLGDIIQGVDDLRRQPSFTAVRRVRGAWRGRAPGIIEAIGRIPRNHLTGSRELTVSRSIRDRAAEEKRETRFLEQAELLAGLPNKRHRQAIQELRAQLGSGEIWRVDNLNFGVLEAAEWLLSAEDPFVGIEGACHRLRAYHLLGTDTANKRTSEIERLSRDAKRDLDLIGRHLRHIRRAGSFFEPNHLARLTAWASEAFGDRTQRQIVLVQGGISIREGRSAPQELRLPQSWEPPGALLFEMIEA